MWRDEQDCTNKSLFDVVVQKLPKCWIMLSGFCHFCLIYFLVLWQSPDAPVLSCLCALFCVLCSTQLVFYTSYVLSCCLVLWYLFYWPGVSLCHVLSCQFVLPRPSCYLIIGSFAPPVLPHYLLCLLSLFILPVFAVLCRFVVGSTLCFSQAKPSQAKPSQAKPVFVYFLFSFPCNWVLASSLTATLTFHRQLKVTIHPSSTLWHK